RDRLGNIKRTRPSCLSSRNDYGITVNSRAYGLVDIGKGRTKSGNGFCLCRAASGEKQRREEHIDLLASPSCRSTSRSRVAIQPGGYCIIRPEPKGRSGRPMAPRPTSSATTHVSKSAQTATGNSKM